MLPFCPEKLESMRARLPDAISTVYDADEISKRPGEQRRQVFDFEDGVRCIVSIDKDSEERLLHPFLHFSFSCRDWTKLNLIQFLNRIEAIPVEFWPDTILLEIKRFQTPHAVHIVYEVPHRFLKVCEGIPKTDSSAP